MRDAKPTEMQELFVIHFTSTPGAIGNASEAARRAGYSEKTAAEQGSQLLKKPHVQAAIAEANRRSISSSAATKSVALVERIVDDEDVPIRIRLDAAKTILDRAGYVPPKASEAEETNAKPLEEMSIGELEDFVADMMAKRASAVKPEMDGARNELPPINQTAEDSWLTSQCCVIGHNSHDGLLTRR